MSQALKHTLAQFTVGDWALVAGLVAVGVMGFWLFARSKVNTLAGGHRAWGWIGFVAGMLATLTMAVLLLGFAVNVTEYLAGGI